MLNSQFYLIFLIINYESQKKRFDCWFMVFLLKLSKKNIGLEQWGLKPWRSKTKEQILSKRSQVWLNKPEPNTRAPKSKVREMCLAQVSLQSSDLQQNPVAPSVANLNQARTSKLEFNLMVSYTRVRHIWLFEIGNHS